MEVGPDHELRVYVRVMLDAGAGWPAKELAGQAVTAIARWHLWMLPRKARMEIEGMGDQVFRHIELHEQALAMWRSYEETGDRAALTTELRDIVTALESLVP